MNREIIDLHNEYNKGSMNRREFLKKLSILAGGAVSVLLSQIESGHAMADVIAKDDPRLHSVSYLLITS